LQQIEDYKFERLRLESKVEEDIPIFFKSIEKLVDSVKVPVELHAKLLSPQLSERARSQLLRFDHKRQDDYDEVRTFLLSEFQLTPFQFKSCFENA